MINVNKLSLCRNTLLTCFVLYSSVFSGKKYKKSSFYIYILQSKQEILYTLVKQRSVRAFSFPLFLSLQKIPHIKLQQMREKQIIRGTLTRKSFLNRYHGTWLTSINKRTEIYRILDGKKKSPSSNTADIYFSSNIGILLITLHDTIIKKYTVLCEITVEILYISKIQ